MTPFPSYPFTAWTLQITGNPLPGSTKPDPTAPRSRSNRFRTCGVTFRRQGQISWFGVGWDGESYWGWRCLRSQRVFTRWGEGGGEGGVKCFWRRRVKRLGDAEERLVEVYGSVLQWVVRTQKYRSELGYHAGHCCQWMKVMEVMKRAYRCFEFKIKWKD